MRFVDSSEAAGIGVAAVAVAVAVGIGVEVVVALVVVDFAASFGFEQNVSQSKIKPELKGEYCFYFLNLHLNLILLS